MLIIKLILLMLWPKMTNFRRRMLDQMINYMVHVDRNLRATFTRSLQYSKFYATLKESALWHSFKINFNIVLRGFQLFDLKFQGRFLTDLIDCNKKQKTQQDNLLGFALKLLETHGQILNLNSDPTEETRDRGLILCMRGSDANIYTEYSNKQVTLKERGNGGRQRPGKNMHMVIPKSIIIFP